MIRIDRIASPGRSDAHSPPALPLVCETRTVTPAPAGSV